MTAETLRQAIRDSLVIRRLEYRIAEFPLYAVPILIESDRRHPLPAFRFWEGLLLFGFLLVFGDLINCLYDRDLDARYKPHLSAAVYRLGVRNVALQAGLAGAAAVLLAGHLAWTLPRWILLPAVPAGLLLAWAYSAPPLRVKGRGPWQLVWYWSALFVSPMCFAALLVRPLPSAELLWVAAAFATTQTGVLLANTAEDYPEDRAAGVRTVIVALGLARGIRLAAGMVSLGAPLLTGGLAWLYLTRGVTHAGWVALLPIAVVGASAAVGLARLAGSIREAGPDPAITAVRQVGRWVPVWIGGVAVSTLGAVAVLYYSAAAPP